MISEEQREALKKAWSKNGDCRSCGWHSSYYEVDEHIEEAFERGDFEEDGSIWVPCLYDVDSHRGSNIYDFRIT